MAVDDDSVDAADGLGVGVAATRCCCKSSVKLGLLSGVATSDELETTSVGAAATTEKSVAVVIPKVDEAIVTETTSETSLGVCVAATTSVAPLASV